MPPFRRLLGLAALVRLLRRPPAGCVGQDARASTMESIMSGLGVEARYQKEEATPTGTCAVCIVGGERSLVANLAAANNYKVDHCRANWDLVERAQICYRQAGTIIVGKRAPSLLERSVMFL